MKQIILLCLVLLVIMVGCGHYSGSDLRSDDDFSESIKEKFGDSFRYNYHEETERYGSYYTFEITEQNKETVANFFDFVNEELSGSDEKITISVGIVQVEGLGVPFSIRNYTDENGDKSDLNGFYNLQLIHLKFRHDSFWDDLSIYSSFSGIRYLTVTDIIQQQAEEQGIDWYEYWPELEKVEIIDTSGWNK